MKTKKCSKCGKIKKVEYFNKDKNDKSGLQRWCKECTKQYRKDNSELFKILNKKSYLKNKDSLIKNGYKYMKERDSGMYIKYWSAYAKCNYKTHTKYKDAGKKGIIMIWKSYKEFKDDMYDSYKKNIKKYGQKNIILLRINPKGNYSKENCRWALKQEINSSRIK